MKWILGGKANIFAIKPTGLKFISDFYEIWLFISGFIHCEYEYKINNGTLKLDFVEDVVRDCDYSYSIEGKKLTLTGGEGTDGGTYELNKVSQ